MKKKDFLFFIVVVMLLVAYFEDYVESDKETSFPERAAFEPPTRIEGVWKLVELVRGCGGRQPAKIPGTYAVYRGQKRTSFVHAEDGQTGFVVESKLVLLDDNSFSLLTSEGFYYSGMERKHFHIDRVGGTMSFDIEKNTARLTTNTGLALSANGAENFLCPEGETMEFLYERLSHE